MARDPDRRVSLVSDRRRFHRGGRRAGDQLVWYPSSVLPCPACLTGQADIVAIAPDGDLRKLTYRCGSCEQEFEQRAEP
jgi:hypothetical protein